MTTTYLKITPRDPLIARDGRPFLDGTRTKSLEWLYPSVVAGSLRSLLGKTREGATSSAEVFDGPTVASLKRLALSPALPLVEYGETKEPEMYFPAPQDAVLKPTPDSSFGEVIPAAPFLDFKGFTDLPHQLAPVLSLEKDDFKPLSMPAFWSRQRIVKWLTNPARETIENCDSDFLQSPTRDHRIHVKITPEVGTAEDAMLFSTTGLDFTDARFAGEEEKDLSKRITLSLRVESEDEWNEELSKLNDWHPLGGERRLAHWNNTQTEPKFANCWDCPDEIQTCLGSPFHHEDKSLIRMLLASPAYFGTSAWHPEWLSGAEPSPLIGTIPGTDVEVELVAGCINRWNPLSGWSYEQGSVGPKPVRRLVAAGSVYFFQVLKGDPQSLAGRWLAPVCTADDGQWARDGFGLALWGTWSPGNSK